MADVFKVEIWDRPENEELYAEITYGGQLLAEITQEEGYEALDFTVLPREDNEPWRFKLAPFEEAIGNARRRLWELRRRDEAVADQ
jgi:hypothetical protein